MLLAEIVSPTEIYVLNDGARERLSRSSIETLPDDLRKVAKVLRVHAFITHRKRYRQIFPELGSWLPLRGRSVEELDEFLRGSNP